MPDLREEAESSFLRWKGEKPLGSHQLTAFVAGFSADRKTTKEALRATERRSSWTLLTVSYGGEVRQTPGFSSLRLCEQAASLALTGMTIEENEERNRNMVCFSPPPERTVRDAVFPGYLTFSPPYDPARGEAVVQVRGQWIKKSAQDIAIAKCLIANEAATGDQNDI